LKALIIEDEADVVEAISLCLQMRWPEVTLSVAADGSKGVEILKSTPLDIVILDINLPDISGFEVLKQVRSFSNVPIIIVTVRGGEDDQIKGLEMGADDYIVKPFRPRDLIARVNSMLRRTYVSGVTAEEPSIVRGKLMLNLSTNKMRLGEVTAKLTPTECKVLYILIKNAEHTLSSKKILQEVWEKEYVTTDLLRKYIQRVRNKLKDRPPKIILNQRGGGYRFVSPK